MTRNQKAVINNNGDTRGATRRSKFFSAIIVPLAPLLILAIILIALASYLPAQPILAAEGTINKVYQHWADGDADQGSSAEWNNNILSDNKSDYFEGEVIPHVYVYKASNNTPLTNGQSYSFNITYNYYQQNTNAGGFAYMTTYNISRQPDLLGATVTPITPTLDNVFTNTGGMESSGVFYTVDADITDVSDVTYDGTGTLDGKVTVTFTYIGTTTTAGFAEIYYGLYIAEPGQVPDQGSGTTEGASEWTGGSLQTTTDIGGSGATSIQLNPAAIIRGQISGMKFNDLNGNGIKDDGETGLAGWTIVLDTDSDPLTTTLITTTTDANGNYFFSVTPDADKTDPDNDPYYVYEVQQDNWTQTAPASGFYGPLTVTSLTPQYLDQDFGNIEFIPVPSIDIEKSTNGDDADTPTGPNIAVGDTVTWTYRVKNTGNVDLSNVTVVDDNGTPGDTGDDYTCVIGSLASGAVDDTTCTQSGTAAPGQYANQAAVSGEYGGMVYQDSDPSHYFGIDASIDIEKSTNGDDADTPTGPNIAVGDTVTWTYRVENTGNVGLSNVTVVDDNGTPGDTGDDYTCVIVSLASGAVDTTTCTQSGTAASGQYANLATVSGSFNGFNVSDSDPSHYFGVDASIDIEKSTNGDDADTPTGPNIAVGDTVTWTYRVENTGNVGLSNVTVVDDNGTPGDTGDDYTCVIGSLASGAVDTTTCTQSGTAASGQYANLATVSGSFNGFNVSDSDPSHYFGVDASIDIEKSTNGDDADTPTGPNIAVGDTVTWTYRVENTGNVGLSNVTVVDDNGTPGDTGDDYTCVIGSLASGAVDTTTCTQSGTAASGQYANLATVSGSFNGFNVSDSDPSHYFGVDASIDIEKSTNGDDADTPTGPNIAVGDTVTWTYRVENTGNVGLSSVTVVDDNGTPGDTGDDYTCVIGSLASGAVDTTTCTQSGTAASGQYANQATASGSFNGFNVSDSDPSHYFGSAPSIDLVKTGSFNDEDGDGFADVDETITYSFTVTNDGNVTLSNVTLADTVGGVTISGGPIATLAVDASDSTTFSGSYTITQDDIDDGGFFNTALATGTDPNGDPVTDPDDHDEDLPQNPSIMLEKTGTFEDVNDDGFADVGETISYSFTVTNDGNVTLTNVVISDTVGGVTISGGPIATLAVDASDSTTFSGSYTITQDDIDDGGFFNTALATGTDPNGDPVTDPDDHDEDLPQNPSIMLEKTGTFEDVNDDGFADVGETISYSFTVTNDGNVTLTNVVISDTVGGVTISGGPIVTLAVDASDSTTFSGSYTITQDDIDDGGFFNTALATGTDPNGDPVTDPDDHDEDLPQNPSIMLEKTGTFEDVNDDGFADVGETISYSFTVTNDGNVTLTNVVISDTVGGVTISGGPIATLAVDASDSTTFSGSYTITQDDIDDGGFFNTALATGTDPNGDPVTDPDDHDEDLPQNPSIMLEKTGTFEDVNDDGFADVGETISYSFTVTNDGNVTLTNVVISDTVGGVTISGGPIATLAVDASDSTTFSGSYTITQDDIDDGGFFNTALATGTDPNGDPVTDPDDHDEDLPQNPSIMLEKTGTFEDVNDDGFADVGETISYSFTVTNDGNVTLTNVVISDTVGGVTISGGPIATLAVDASDSTTFSGSYTITQDDIDDGGFFNTALATGTDPNGDPVTDPDDHDEDLPQNPSIMLEKTGTFEDVNDDGFADVGETISYSFTVTNDGNVTLTNVVISDTVGGVTISGGPIATLAVDASDSTTFSGSYTITQDDIDDGGFFNTALATGTDPNGDPVTDPDDHDEDLPQNPSIMLEKTGTFEDVNDDGFADVGETISYSFTVTNDGNVTLTNVVISDTVGGVTISGGPIATLAVDASDSTTFSGSYTITQDDIDDGGFFNTALATGTDPNGDPVTDPDDHDEDLPQNPSIMLEKTGTFEDVNDDGFADVGETISYSFTVTNDGNVTLTNVVISDTVGGVTISGGPIATLAVDASDSTTFSGSYTITQDDIDDGGFFNTALATGTDPNGDPVTDPDDHDEDLPQNPSIMLEKTGTFEDVNDDGFADVGETISYSFTVTNDGNVTLTNVVISDTVGGVTISGGPIATLAVDASDSTTFSGSYTITQDDIDDGGFFNTALATGTDPNGDPVTDPDDHDEDLPQNPSIMLEKTGTFEDVNDDGFADVGETISYSFTVTNDGNVTLTNVVISDTVGGVTISGGPIATLAVDASDSTTFSGSYTITQDDIDDGGFFNTALATGTDPNGDPVTDPDDHDEDLPQNPSIMLEKTGTFEDVNDDGFADVGETISYSFTVTNDGNVTLTNVVISDTVGGVTISGGPIATLAVDASDSTTFSGSYTITQDDIDDGGFFNTALATGTDPNGDPVTDPDDHDEDLPQNPSIMLEKTGTFEDVNDDGFADVGETISYSFTVTNDGNVTLTNVVISDTVGGVTISGGPIATLAVDASDSTTFSGSYTITQDDIDDGGFFNTALATGTDPNGDPVTDPDDHDEDLPQNPVISIVKTFADDSVIAGGVGSSFTLTVTNDGNVTLSDALIKDTVDSRLTVTGVSVTTATAAGGETCDTPSQDVSCSIPTLAVGESATITVNFTVASDVEEANGVGGLNNAASVPNTATVAAEAPQGDPGDPSDDITDTDSDTIDILTEIELAITKNFYRFDDDGNLVDVEFDQIEQGTNGFFTIVVTNTGPSDAVGVVVTDTVNGLLEVVEVQSTELDCSDSAGQDIDCTFDIPVDGSVTVTVEYTAAEFLDPDDGPIYGTNEGDEFRFVFVNGYVLEGSSDTDGAATLILTDPNGITETIPYDGTKNDFFFDPPAVLIDGELVDNPGFIMHLSCSDTYFGGYSDGAGGPVFPDDESWQISSYSILRYNQNGFFKGCGDVVVPWDVPNTAFADGTDSDSEYGTDELVSDTDTVMVIRQLKIEIRNEPVIKGKKMDVLLNNTGGDVLTITEITIEWPSVTGNLVRVQFGAQNTIWTGSDDPTDATIIAFEPSSDLTIDPGEALKLGFFFQSKTKSGTYTVTVTLEGGLTTEVTTITADL